MTNTGRTLSDLYTAQAALRRILTHLSRPTSAISREGVWHALGTVEAMARMGLIDSGSGDIPPRAPAERAKGSIQ